METAQSTLALIDQVSHPYSSGVGLYWATTFHRLRREGRATREKADAFIALSSEQEFSMFLAFGTILRGSVLADQND